MPAKPEENAGGRSPPAPRPPEGDELDPLPPLDGGEGEDEATAPEELDDDEVAPGDEGADPFDDRTGEDEPAPELEAGEAGGEGERSWLSDAEPAEPREGALPDFDLVDLPDASAPTVLTDVDEPGVGEEDFGLDDGEGDQGLDAGDEGPTGPDEEIREEDLPALDADDEDDLDGSTLFELPLDEDPETPLPWDGASWQPAGTPFDVGPTAALACGARDVLAFVESDGGDGHTLVRLDLEGGTTRLPARGAPARADSLVVVGDDLWIEDAGRRFVSSDGGVTFTPASGRERAEPADGSAEADVPVVPGARVAAAVRGPQGSVLAALVGAKNGRTWLARLRHGGESGSTLLAEISADADAEVRALAWDEARGVVWVGGSFGVVALQPPAVLPGAGAGAEP